MNNYTYDDIDDDIFSFYIDSLNGNGGDKQVAIQEASIYFMEDETFIEDIVDRYLNGNTDEEDENDDN